MKRIDLEAHFFTQEYLDYLRSRTAFPKLETIQDGLHQKFERLYYTSDLFQSPSTAMRTRLLDLHEGRLEEMNAAGIDIQVLSLCDPGCEPFDVPEAVIVSKKTNDMLSLAVNQQPDRFIGLASLAPQDPNEAANELERAVTELGLKGAKINSNIRGEYLDDRRYWVIFERAERLGVPIYLHPTVPSSSMLTPYAAYGYALAGASLGFAAETALHVMRLIYSGVFDQFPGLKFILGHLGEGLPFWLHRINLGWLKPAGPGELRPRCLKMPSDYIKTNFIVTTSGMFFQPALLCTYLALGAENVAFAIDYPFENSIAAVQSMEAMPICEADKGKIYYLNAKKLFKLDNLG